MAIQVDFTFKSIPIPAAYCLISSISGGKVRGEWEGVLSVFANKDLSKPKKVITREYVPAVPATPDIPATEENCMIQGTSEIPEIPEESHIVPPDPIFQLRVVAKYSSLELNPYVLLYTVAKEQVGGIDC